ncbi:NupC/NupG family nucleoside CNT transporter [Alkalicoccobacillus plakortidis]|uniref:NupC/NupG family nucleoside CNT transporter n=1 Tax=Alkalicoccobacillus plakortidis TaxID=444060 RepID=A0ABT0XKC5_9BACI|nr:nucleoside transporter C-terminal domain-containing protein [Alkalicoccobacillus plakortidis]MCM2676354.1 NupC/NupG family nucleoside CNT transporter [Alkalicoccobacillus plakortidis]
MSILIGILGVVVFLGLAFLMSNKKKSINYKSVAIMLGLQVVITLFMFRTDIGLFIVETISGAFSTVISYGNEGVNFVLGDLMIVEGGSVFFLDVLMIIIFTSALLSILTFTGVLPVAIKYVGGLMAKITGLPKVETFNAVNSVFFGQSEALLAIKSQLPTMTKNRVFIVTTSAMASVSASIIGAYFTMLEPRYVLVAMLLNMINGLIVASIIAPVEKREIDEQLEVDTKALREQSGSSLFDAISRGALDGGKVALIVAAMLVAFIGIIAMLNGMFAATIGLTLQELLGYIFAPFAWLMGIPTVDLLQTGNLMGTKLVANEFVAMLDFVNMDLTPKATGIISVFLTSFAGVGSVGIVAGTAQAINEKTGKQVASFGLKLLAAATLVSLMSGTMVGLFI